MAVGGIVFFFYGVLVVVSSLRVYQPVRLLIDMVRMYLVYGLVSKCCCLVIAVLATAVGRSTVLLRRLS